MFIGATYRFIGLMNIRQRIINVICTICISYVYCIMYIYMYIVHKEIIQYIELTLRPPYGINQIVTQKQCAHKEQSLHFDLFKAFDQISAVQIVHFFHKRTYFPIKQYIFILNIKLFHIWSVKMENGSYPETRQI